MVVLKRQWSSFFKWQWLVGLIWVGLLLLPMCIGLYQQFDLHPEKVMYGRSGTSGLRFFFWTQSFGRLTGENVWKNNADIFFLCIPSFGVSCPGACCLLWGLRLIP
jgi:hypothetical protein